ncbi:hypothetical protein [Bremerella sp.]|uniref:hypothetical protein n=1 Tax=Bremerella sp. TaxID=2795602 RepID=UPI00391AAC41
MELFLQVGAKMKRYTCQLIDQWGGGTAILSPRDLDDSSLVKFSDETRAVGGQVLFDPQFYLPHSAHAGLRSHAYWPNDYDTGLFWTSPALYTLVNELIDLNARLGSAELILPGLLADTVNSMWLDSQISIINQANLLSSSHALIATVALSPEATRDDAQISMILDAASSWNVQGVYIVCQHPNGSYLVEDPIWLANVLDLAAGFKQLKRKVIIGYCNQQLLAAACVNADAICSGTWRNVRSFPPEKFEVPIEDRKTRAKWYYCPTALSEYKLLLLDGAFRVGLLSSMSPSADLDGGYTHSLFSGVQPTSADFRQENEFCHYLHALHEQSSNVTGTNFDEAVSKQNGLLDAAEALLSTLSTSHISGDDRDFRNILSANRMAIGILNSTRGPLLRRHW